MEFDSFTTWSEICFCLPLTTLAIFWVCCVVRREQAPVIYYTNLLISNIIQFSVIIFRNFNQGSRQVETIGICTAGVMTSLYFRMFIAIERCFVIAYPQSNWIRHTGGSMLVSVLVWAFCISTVSLTVFFGQIIVVFVLGLLPAPLFIFFSAWTFKALPAATSVPTDKKRRIVGTLVLLFINIFLMILPSIISFIILSLVFFNYDVMFFSFVLFLLSPIADLILVFFMQKGPIDKLLSRLCCCIKNNTTADVAGHQQPHELKLQGERERESKPNCREIEQT